MNPRSFLGDLALRQMTSERALVAMHAQLEEGAAARGGSGGLGFAKAPKPPNAAKPPKAAKALAKEQKREFSSTTAGAVAAGHWDPWARPVEFQMKQVNRTAGGLYSMFVKGATIGGTAEASSNSAAAGAAAPAATAKPFKWRREIKAVLEARGSACALKDLRKGVVKAARRHYAAANNAPSKPELRALFRTKLKEIGVLRNGSTVSLK